MQETWVQPLGQKVPWTRAWQLTLVFLPGKSHKVPSKESDKTDQVTLSLSCWRPGATPGLFKQDLGLLDPLQCPDLAAHTTYISPHFCKNLSGVTHCIQPLQLFELISLRWTFSRCQISCVFKRLQGAWRPPGRWHPGSVCPPSVFSLIPPLPAFSDFSEYLHFYHLPVF